MHYSKPKFPVATTGLFFERAFSYGMRTQIITKDRIDQIVEEGAKATVQVAEVIDGSAKVYSNLERAKRRVVGLVSLYLDSVSKWDLDAAARMIQDESLVTLSRGGSMMLKELARKPSSPDIWFPDAEHSLSVSYTNIALLSDNPYGKYESERITRMKNENIMHFAFWLARTFEGISTQTKFLQKYQEAGTVNAENYIASFLLTSIMRENGLIEKNAPHIPTELEFRKMIRLIRKKSMKITQLKELEESIPEEFLAIFQEKMKSTMKGISDIREKGVTENYIFEQNFRLFLLDPNESDAISHAEWAISKQWEELSGKKNELPSMEIRYSFVFCAIAWVEPRREISPEYAIEILQILENPASYYPEKRLDNFLCSMVPPQFHATFRDIWEEMKESLGDIIQDAEMDISVRMENLRDYDLITEKKKKNHKKEKKS